MKRLALSALVALGLLAAAPSAWAHTELIGSDPAEGATLAQPPSRLTLTFSQPVPAESATVTVTAPDGTGWTVGELSVSGATLTAPVTPGASPAGQYVVSWQVESLDGDFVSGKTTFSLATAAPPAVGTTTAPSVTSEPPAITSSVTPTETITLVATAPPTIQSGQPAEGDGFPVWGWVVGALVVVAAGVAVALRLRGRSG
ncbi:copper resistance protein CopC [Saccharothrix sp.]|uniref:copper resistance CopC family protein n=1 Tax=Saccharothrix sp. TaxID=1873460 RepID=UPI0028127AFD|nr:copper resistance protein CopC [Saccharothrix sp.]